MSSTNRGGKRNAHDYYVTPHEPIRRFMHAWFSDDDDAARELSKPGARFFDPCAGGNDTEVSWQFKNDQLVIVPPTPMSYPHVLGDMFPRAVIVTNDIRKDSPAAHHADFVGERVWNEVHPFDMVISNPPFFLAMEFIERALMETRPGGYVVMLLRLNYFGSEKRFPFFQRNAPVRAYVDHVRMGFTPGGGTDSVEYMHAIWRRGIEARTTSLRVI